MECIKGIFFPQQISMLSSNAEVKIFLTLSVFINTIPMKLLTIILCILLPPLAVALEKGLEKDFLINLLLTILGWLPGVIHGFYVLSR